MGQLSYRGRLTLAYAVIFGVAVVLLTATAYATVQLAFHAAFDERLATTAAAVRPIPDVRGGRIVFDPDDRVQFSTVLRDAHADGAVVTTSGAVVDTTVADPPAALLRALAGSAMHRGDVRAGARDLGYVMYPIFDRAGRKRLLGAVGVWDDRRVYDRAARWTLAGLVAAGLVLLAVATAAGGLLIRKMLAPVAQLSALISEIEASDLSKRIAWSGPNDELGRLCATFDRLLNRLETAFERERRFTADASHELRTPLSVLRAEIELALTRDRTTAAYRATLERLQRETRRLVELAENLLTIARIEAGRNPAEAVIAVDVARRASERLRLPAQTRGVTVRVTGAPSIRVLSEERLLESAIVALLENALRFTPPGRSVDVSVTGECETATIAVRDAGPGFSESALHNATGRFWRDDDAPNGPGTGLGLAIVNAIVERQHGRLVLRNAADGGAVAEVLLPTS